MKKIYQKPSIKVLNIESESVMAGSGEAGAKIGGNTGIGIGEGEPPTSGAAKSHSMFDLGNNDASSPGVSWDD